MSPSVLGESPCFQSSLNSAWALLYCRELGTRSPYQRELQGQASCGALEVMTTHHTQGGPPNQGLSLQLFGIGECMRSEVSPHHPRGCLLGSLGKEARRALSSQNSALLASIFPESELSSSGFVRPQRLSITGAGHSLFHQSPHWPWTPQAGVQMARGG